MPASKPQRPTPGVALALPSVSDEATQRALDRVALAIWQLQSQLGRLGGPTGIFTATEPGLAPAGGAGSTLFLRQDGVYSLPAGAAVADADYGDVEVTGGGTVWSVPDLATKVPTTRTITTTAPLTIGGGASADLSADRTIAVADFSTGARGVTSASGAAGNFLLGDNTWITLAQLIVLLNLGLGQFGDGSDAAATMDGSTAVVGCTLAAGVYTGTRATFFTNLTINGGVVFKPDGYETCVRGTLTLAGDILCNGGDASGPTAGAASSSGTRQLPIGLGGVVGGGANGTASPTAPRGADVTAAPGGAQPLLASVGQAPSGTAGGILHGGGGGAGGNIPSAANGNAGGAGGVPTPVPASDGDIHCIRHALEGRTTGNTKYTLGTPGGAGAQGAIGTGGTGAASGGTGGMIVLKAFNIVAAGGSIKALAGLSGAGTFAGGGGGGSSGGVIALETTTPTASLPPLLVTGAGGGLGGAGGAAGGNPGGNGALGGDGLKLIFN